MTATTLLKTLILCEPTGSKLDTATNVLYELKRIKKMKGMPFLVVRRAIKMQENIIKKLQNEK